MGLKFKRKIEDFTCGCCGARVKGNGYTNHCPHCLWSKHVDINPGDRLAGCGGLMEPVEIETKSDGHLIVHRCQKCGYQKRNKTVKEDNIEEMIKLSQKIRWRSPLSHQ